MIEELTRIKEDLQAKSTIPALNSCFLRGMGATTAFSAKAEVFCGIKGLGITLTI